MDGLSVGGAGRTRTAIVDHIAFVILIFATGLAVALTLGGVVLLLAAGGTQP